MLPVFVCPAVLRTTEPVVTCDVGNGWGSPLPVAPDWGCSQSGWIILGGLEIAPTPDVDIRVELERMPDALHPMEQYHPTIPCHHSESF